METMKAVNQNFTDFEDLIVYLDCTYNDMLENTNKLDNLFWDIEKEGFSAKLLSQLRELVNMFDAELVKLFEIEKYIYDEMDEVMPDQSSVAALKHENECILKLMNTIKTLLSDKEGLKKQKDILQAELISLADIIQRNIHKKGGIMFHEARTFVPEDRLDKIVIDLKTKNILIGDNWYNEKAWK